MCKQGFWWAVSKCMKPCYISARLQQIATLLTRIMRGFLGFTGKQLAYLSLETPGGALKAAAEVADLGK